MARQACGDGKCGELRGWNSPGFTGHAVRKDPESAEIAMIRREFLNTGQAERW